MRRNILCICGIICLILAGCTQKPEQKPLDQSPPKEEKPVNSTLMEASEKDPYENGCVSCHKKTAEVDRSLPSYVKRIQGHPEVKEASVTACYNCHEAEKDYNSYKKFYRGIHKSHWESKIYYLKNKGTCFSCHTVETNGVSGIKDYPPAGYRTGIKLEQTVPPKQPQPQQPSQPEEPNKMQDNKKQTEPESVKPEREENLQKEQEQRQNRTEPEEIPTPAP